MYPISHEDRKLHKNNGKFEQGEVMIHDYKKEEKTKREEKSKRGKK